MVIKQYERKWHIKKKINQVCNKINKSAQKTGRQAKDITLIAVTKNQPLEVWNQLKKTDIINIGENRVQETIAKIKKFSQEKTFKYHLIGHLQKNKVKKAIETYDIIQTVNSLELAEKINTVCKKNNKTQEIFIQINISKDPKKQGFYPEKINETIKKIIKKENLLLTGVMTIPKNGLEKKELSTQYSKIKKIQQFIKKNICNTCDNISMGMSNDYEIAISEGATHIRIGTALFGKRSWNL